MVLRKCLHFNSNISCTVNGKLEYCNYWALAENNKLIVKFGVKNQIKYKDSVKHDL